MCDFCVRDKIFLGPMIVDQNEGQIQEGKM